MVTTSIPPGTSLTKLGKRALSEHSQTLRSTVQLAFLLLNLWIGVQFYLFVRYYETGGRSIRVSRPPGVEGWLPIASLMNLKALLQTGHLPAIHPAGTLLLIAFLALSLIFRKSFCGWLCPVGTVSEYLWRLGMQTVRKELPSSARSGHNSAGTQICPDGLVHLRRRIHVSSGDTAIPR